MTATKHVVGSADAKFDILKFILAVCVVAIHAGVYQQLLFPWLRIVVPVFFMISSYFLFSKLNRTAESDHWRVVKNYVFRNLKLYCFWFVVLLPFTLYIRRMDYFANGLWKGLHIFFRGLLFGGTFSASWYITASAMGAVLIYCLSRRLKNRGTLAVALMGFCFATLWSSYRLFLSKSDLLCQLAGYYKFIFGGPFLSFPVALIWVLMGKFFAEGKLSLKNKRTGMILLAICCVGLWLEWYFVKRSTGAVNNDSYFMLLPTGVILFGLILQIKPVTNPYGVYFRRASTVVYTTHLSLVYAIDFLTRRLLNITHPLLMFFAAPTCSLLIYGCIELIIHRFPDSKFSKLLKNAY